MKKLFPVLSLLAVMAMVGCSNNSSSKKEESKEAPKSSQVSSSAAASSQAATSQAASSQAASSEAEHEHEWTDDNKVADVNIEKCACNKKAYRVDVADADGWNKPTTKMNGKSGADAMSTWDITAAIPAGSYKVEMYAAMTNATHSNRYFFNHVKNGKDDNGNPPDNESESDFRYFFKVNGGDDINPATQQTWGELGFGTTQAYIDIETTITIPEGATSFSLCHGNIGYSLIIGAVRLVQA